MADEFEDDGLPELPSYVATHQPQISRPNLKKRAYSNFSDAPNTSSDPPLFSSDDTPDSAGLENYEGKRKKSKHAGPWWRQGGIKSRRPASRSGRTEGLERNFDSGVWMNSDDTEASGFTEDGDCQADTAAVAETSPFPPNSALLLPISRDLSFLPANSDIALPLQHSSQTSRTFAPPFPSQSPALPPRARMSELGEYVQQEDGTLQDDEADDSVEAFYMSDEQRVSLSNEDLGPLFTVIRKPKFHDKPPSEDCFEPFTPNIKLFLANNLLTTFPSKLWSLEYLTVLSVRNNSLTELPPSISKLRNLRELNIANNNLRYLPYELTTLLNAAHPLRLLTSGNPFFQGADLTTLNDPSLLSPTATQRPPKPSPALLEALAAEQDATKATALAWLLKDQEQQRASAATTPHLRFIAATSPALFLQDGRTVRSSPPAPSSLPPHDLALSAPVRTAALGTFGSPRWPAVQPPNMAHTPSLLELSLRKACELGGLEYLSTVGLGAGVSQPASMAAQSKAETGEVRRACSVCGRGYVVARGEWVEYWVVGSFGAQGRGCVPFLRRACGWGCVGGRMGEAEVM